MLLHSELDKVGFPWCIHIFIGSLLAFTVIS